MGRWRTYGLLVVLLALSGVACTRQPFTVEMPADAAGVSWEQSAEGPWHRADSAAGGLGFEVAIADWPRLIQRGYLDFVFHHQGTRDVEKVCKYLDLGQIRVDGAGGGKLVEANWCYRRYSFGAGSSPLGLYVSRLSPAVLAVTEADTLDLFAGDKYGGERWGETDFRHGDFRRLPTTKVITRSGPAHVAFVRGGQVVVADTTSPVALEEMDEPWLLFWHGASSEFFRTAVPNLLWRYAPLTEAILRGNYLIRADIPVLVVLQRKASQLSPVADGLRLSFGAGGAGAVAVLPLLGLSHPKAEATAGWVQQLPQDVADRCRTWSGRLKSFPLSCQQSFLAAADASEVTIRNEFTHLPLPDEWGTVEQPFAPVPPVAALAAQYGLPVELSGRLLDQAIPTHSGPYTGVGGTRVVEMTLRGLDRYIDEAVVSPPAQGQDARALVEELSEELRKMVQAGPLAPAWVFGRKHESRNEIFFADVGETLQTIADALPYLDEASRREALVYAAAEQQRQDPLRAERVELFGLPRREYFRPVEPVAYEQAVEAPMRSSLGIGRGQRLNNIYALWSLAQAGGDWSYLRDSWGLYKQMLQQAEQGCDWATCGYFGRADSSNGMPATHEQFARLVAVARVADRFGDRDAKALAACKLAKVAMLRFAQGKYVRYAFDTGIESIELGEDWLLKLSTGRGENGVANLWMDRWGGADEDIRLPIRWDEFGPTLQYFTGDWTPRFLMFQSLTPEVGRFLRDHLPAESQWFISVVEQNAPAWHMTHRESYVGKETSIDSPVNAFTTFLAKCYVQGVEGDQMVRYQDVPFVRVGDLFHMQRLVANLRTFGGLRFERIQGAAQ